MASRRLLLDCPPPEQARESRTALQPATDPQPSALYFSQDTPVLAEDRWSIRPSIPGIVPSVICPVADSNDQIVEAIAVVIDKSPHVRANSIRMDIRWQWQRLGFIQP